MQYRFFAARVFTCRWPEAVAFYRDVIGLPLVFSDERLGWAQYDLGGVFLGLERCDPDDPVEQELVGRFAGISLAVDDIQASYQQLKKRKVRFSAPPEQQLWGGVLAHFYDLDDNVLTLIGSRSD